MRKKISYFLLLIVCLVAPLYSFRGKVGEVTWDVYAKESSYFMYMTWVPLFCVGAICGLLVILSGMIRLEKISLQTLIFTLPTFIAISVIEIITNGYENHIVLKYLHRNLYESGELKRLILPYGRITQFIFGFVLIICVVQVIALIKNHEFKFKLKPLCLIGLAIPIVLSVCDNGIRIAAELTDKKVMSFFYEATRGQLGVPDIPTIYYIFTPLMIAVLASVIVISVFMFFMVNANEMPKWVHIVTLMLSVLMVARGWLFDMVSSDLLPSLIINENVIISALTVGIIIAISINGLRQKRVVEREKI